VPYKFSHNFSILLLQEYCPDSQAGSSNSPPSTALTWFKCFVESLLDFGDVAAKCVPDVIKTLNCYSGINFVRYIYSIQGHYGMDHMVFEGGGGW